MTESISAGMAILRRDLLLAVSYRFAFAAQFLSVFFSLILFYYVSRLVNVGTFATPDDYYAYVVIGLVVLQALNSTLMQPAVSLRREIVAGTFERLVLSGYGAVRSLLAGLLFPIVNALVTGLLMLLCAWALFGMSVRWSTAALAIPLAVLAALAFAPFGLATLAMVAVFKQANSGTTWVVAAISILAGLYFPVELLPDWIRWASEVQPFTPAVNLLRNVLVGTPRADALWLDLARLVGFTVALLPISMWALDRALRISRRRGTIVEY